MEEGTTSNGRVSEANAATHARTKELMAQSRVDREVKHVTRRFMVPGTVMRKIRADIEGQLAAAGVGGDICRLAALACERALGRYGVETRPHQ